MRNKSLSPALFVAFILSMCLPVNAWDAGGHEIVAWVAIDHLNPKAKARLDELTKKIQGPWPFNPVNVACWMDVLKGNHPGMPYLGLYKPWHYIDLGLKDTDPMPALIPGGDNEMSGNAIVALQRIQVVLKGGTDPYIPAPEIAVAMAMHIVGDIHQPLHASTEYNIGPDGKLNSDRGGNRVAILNSPVDRKGDHLNLHAFWDDAWRLIWDPSTSQVMPDPTYDDPGTGVNPELVRPLAKQWETDDAPPAGTNLEPDFMGWAKESNKLGREITYAHLLHTAGDRQVRIPEAYVTEARDLARKRIVLAGLRLAQFLNETIGADNPGPTPTPWPSGPPAPIMN